MADIHSKGMNPAQGKHIPEFLTASFVMVLAGKHLDISINAPIGPTRLATMLPLIQSVTDLIVESAIEACTEKGLNVSCKKGCGACCVQVVPLAQMEARHIRELLERMPEPRRSVIRNRFAEGERRLQEAGLLERFLDTSKLSEAELQSLGLDYFHQRLQCPFLEEQSCSIHADRPIRCREYLVTSPAEHCANPTAQLVRRLALPGNVLATLIHMEKGLNAGASRWVPLILSLRWAETHQDKPAERPGTELVRELFESLSEKKLPNPTFPL